MSERRSHWTDDLIDTVFRIMDDYAAEVWRREHDHGTPTFNIIAAVEDWQKETFVAASAILAERIERAEVQVQRAREVHQAVVDDEDDPWQVAYATGWDEALQEVRRALDGDSQ